MLQYSSDKLSAHKTSSRKKMRQRSKLKPVSRKAALNLSWDLGAAIGIGGYFNEGTEFYTSIGPGVTFGRQSGGVRGDFSIRFQHMGEGLNAILFRIGIGF